MNPTNVAELSETLNIGDLIESINGVKVTELSFLKVIHTLNPATKPMTITFL